ncbi:MAG TPA: carboxypeptidase-like regulatory domain-containing protein [bacterium]|nr:carboxypeptidase-like regulatory domain-containing protein [bacterium]
MKKSVYLMLCLSLLLIPLLAGAFGCDDDDDDCPRCPSDDDDADDDASDDDDDDTTDDDTTDDDTTDDDTTDDDTTDDDTTDDDTTDDDTTDDDTTDDDTTDDDTTDDDTTDDDTTDDDTTDDDTGDDDTTLHEPEGVLVTGAVTVNETPITTYFAAYNQADVMLKFWSESKGDSFLANVDTDGSYRAPYVMAGTYNVEIEILVYDGEDFFWTYRNSYIVEDLVVGAETVTQDIALTLYSIDGSITDPEENPVEGTTILITGGDEVKEDPTTFALEVEFTMEADAYMVFLPAFDNYTFRYSPLLSTSLPQASENPVAVTTHMNHDFQFPVTGYETRVKLTNDGSSWYYDLGLGASGSMTFTAGSDFYVAEFEGGYSFVDIVLPAGTYDVVIDYRSISYNVYQYTKYFDDTQQITVTAPTKENVLIEVPLIEVTGTITDPEGATLEDVLVKAVSVADGATFEAYNYTDETGVYNLMLPAGTYDLYYNPYYEEDLVREREAGVVVSETLTHDYQFVGTTATLEGTITINDTTPLLFFSSLFVFGDLYLVDQYGIEYYGEMDSDGSYSVTALPGSYTLTMSMDAIIGFDTYFFIEDEEFAEITLSEDKQTQNFNLTMHHLTGNIFMSDGVTPAVPTTIMGTNTLEHITSSDQSEPFMFITSIIWDATGYYSLPVNEGSMNLAMINVDDHLEYCNNILIEGDTELDFVFAWDGETK